MKILIAYDGSSCADLALEDMRRAGLPRQAEAMVLSVSELWMPVVESVGAGAVRIVGALPVSLEKTESIAQTACERVQAYFPDWTVKAEARLGAPATMVIEKADEWRPDLIVVGSQGRSALGRFLLGSVSQKVVTEAHCSVRVARSHESDAEAPARLLIGVDGSPDAEAAITGVAARVWPANSKARVVIALDDVVSEVINQIEGGRAWIHETIEAAGARLRAAGLTVSSQIRKGDPKSILPAEAESWGADCIIVGARGLNRFERFRLGSVSAATAARAHCSVEVVRLRGRAE
ncbi:MAG TPA: universal stress protein [Blastocatellia bacterium]|jgi:Universal stress protein UspA and related nucleotide-binding proteins